MFRFILSTSLALTLGLVFAPASALAKTPKQRIEKLLSKYAVSEQEAFSAKLRPKVACACRTALEIGGGFVVQRDNGQLVCAVGIGYDESGTVFTFAPCADFEVLTR